MKTSFKKILLNFTSLSFLQLSNYIFPLVTFPYLVRVLGPEKYGLVNFAAAFVAYFGIITDYGFNLSATKDISVNRENFNKISEIFSSVLIIKFTLFVICASVFGILVYCIPFFRLHWDIYAISFLTILGQVFFPLWYFQGIEEMKYISIVNIIPKAVVVVLIFLLIKGADDYLVLVILNSFGVLFTGILSLLIVKQKYRIKFFAPKFSCLVYQLKDGWHLFIFSISTSLYTVSNTFILGLFAGNTVVGYFAAADKIRLALMNIISTISQTVYPYLNRIFDSSISDGLAKIKKLLSFVGILSFSLSLILFVFAEEIILIVLGNKYLASIDILRIISWLIFLIGLSNVLGIQTMLNLNFKRAFTGIIIIASLFSLVLSFILVPIYFEIGTAVTVLTTEFLVTIGIIIFLYGKREYLKRITNV
ncbi:flippase [Bacteroidota bacterium]